MSFPVHETLHCAPSTIGVPGGIERNWRYTTELLSRRVIYIGEVLLAGVMVVVTPVGIAENTPFSERCIVVPLRESCISAGPKKVPLEKVPEVIVEIGVSLSRVTAVPGRTRKRCTGSAAITSFNFHDTHQSGTI